MEIGIAEHFVLLATESDAVSDRQLLTRPIGFLVRNRDVLVGVDGAGDKHLLVPVRSDERVFDAQSQGVTLSVRPLDQHGVRAAYADLHCRVRHLDLVFERLVEDITRRLATTPSADAVTVCLATLDDWRSLLRSAGQSLPHDVIVGLVGELEVLGRVAGRTPAKALDAWSGPSGSVHDFVAGITALEVKTTTSIDGKSVAISDIDQMDSGLVESLYLVVVHLRDDPTAPSIAERVDHLLSIGMPHEALMQRLQKVGYVHDMDLRNQDRLEVRSVRVWVVDDAFPGLRRSQLPEDSLHGVSKIRYDLLLDAAPPPLRDDEARKLLAGWIQTP